jgi:hypothetical protein
VSAILYGITATVIVALCRRAGYLSARMGMALLLLPLLFTGRALLTGRVYAPIDLAYQSEPVASMARSVGVSSIVDPALSDVTAQFIPWNAALRTAIAHGHWPLWNPFGLCGSPLAGAAQSAPYHPITLLSLLLPAPDGLTFMAAMTYFLAALSAFLFLRTLCTSEVSALFGAIAWCFSQHVVSFILTAHGAAIAIFPLVLFGVHEVARNGTIRNVALLTAAMTLMTLCGHPETLVHVAAITVAYMLVMARKDLPSLIGRVAGAGLLTVLLTAVFLAPLLDAIPQTREYQDRASHEDIRDRNSWPVVAHLLRADLTPFTEGIDGVESRHHSPDMRHQWAGTAYAGAIVFVPALFALWRSRSHMTWFFAGVVVFSLLAGAEAPGVSALLQHLPLFSIAVNARMIAFAAFGLCALATIGLDRWIAEPSRMDVICLAVAAAIIAIGSLAVNDLSPNFVRLSLGREVLPLLLAFVCLRMSRSSIVAVASLIGLLLLQRTTEVNGLVPTLDRRTFFPNIPGLELLKRDRTPFRVVGLDVLLTPNSAAVYGLEDVRGYEAMTFGRLAATFPQWSVPQAVWSNRVDDLSSPFLSLMNVRYAFIPPSGPVPARWHPLAVFPNYRIVKNDAALPRAFIPAVVHVGTDRDALRKMSACPNFSSEAWIETAGPPAMQANGSGKLSVENSGSQLRLHANMDAPGWVIVSESAWRGWRVLRGNQRLKVYFADHAFIGLYLARGQHDLVVDYWPRAFVTGAAISLATVLSLVLMSLAHVGLLGSRSGRAAPRPVDGVAPSPAGYQ